MFYYRQACEVPYRVAAYNNHGKSASKCSFLKDDLFFLFLPMFAYSLEQYSAGMHSPEHRLESVVAVVLVLNSDRAYFT